MAGLQSSLGSLDDVPGAGWHKTLDEVMEGDCVAITS
jgi:hypothetical protein